MTTPSTTKITHGAGAPAGAAVPRERLSPLESILVAHGLVKPGALRDARDRQAGAKRPLIEVLLEQGALDESRAVEAIERESGMTALGESDLSPRAEVQALVRPEVAQRLGILPLRIEDGQLIVATADPFQLPAFDDLSARVQMPVRARLAWPRAVRNGLRLARPGEEVLHDILMHAESGDEALAFDTDEAKALLTVSSADAETALGLDVTSSDSPVVRFLNLVIADAIRQGASDIHVECEKDALRVRIRVDGDLREVQRVSAGVRTSVISRLKIVSGLDIMETRRPQDGRARVEVGGRPYDLRISTLPSYFGEKAVVRILDPGAPVFDLAKSGIEDSELTAWRGLLHRPHGLVLVTGPTGSGKTSTLYASLLEIRDPSLNVVTIEDPVEFQFPGIVHVPVRADIGLTFASALRSILRQDPDVILLGEIRDAETAEIAIQAALTGHLVLSTLHTNDAAGAVARLINLGVPRHLLASSLLGVMAQRLVRSVCPKCAEPAEWDADLMEQLGVATRPTPAPALRKGRGCANCRASGYRGRAAVAELLTVTPPMRRIILAGGDEQAIRAEGRRGGTRTLSEAGIAKILRGETTAEEVLSVAGPAESDEDDVPRALPTIVRALPPVEADSATGVSVPDRTCTGCSERLAPKWRSCPVCGTPAPTIAGALCAVVCDDQAVQRKIVAATLRPLIATIVEASDGASCLDAVARVRPNLLVVDQQMPGLTGIDVIRRLRSDLATASLPIVMLTASESDELEQQVLLAGADDYMRKPVDPDRFLARVEALLSARRRSVAEVGGR